MPSILQEADGLIHGERQKEYGTPAEHFAHFASLFNAYFAHKLVERFSPEDMLLTMTLLKLARLKNGGTRDSLVDAAGYLGCIELVHPSDPPA